MSFTPAFPAPARTSGGSGYTLGLRKIKDGFTVALNINAAAQERDFRRNLSGELIAVSVGRGQDEGRLMLLPASEGVLASAIIKGSVTLRLKPWDLLPKEPKKGEPCAFVGREGEAVIIRLPKWADTRHQIAAAKGAAA